MIILISIILIVIISVLLAVRSAEHELSIPKEVIGLKISPKSVSGVILFLKKKIVHYTSESS